MKCNNQVSFDLGFNIPYNETLLFPFSLLSQLPV